MDQAANIFGTEDAWPKRIICGCIKIRRLGPRDLHGIVCHRAGGVLHAL